MGGIQPWHIILVVVVFLLLFGGKKLPDAARGLGRSLRILKSEVGAMHEEDGKPKAGSTETETTAAVATPPSQIASGPIPQTPIAQPVVQVPGAAPVAAPVQNGYHVQPGATPVYHAAPAAPVFNGQPVPAQPVVNVPTSGQPSA